MGADGLQYYIDAIMSAMTSQITGVSIVYLTVCSRADEKKKTFKIRVIGLYEGNSPVTGEFPRTKGL